jgi:hypothetical protein
MKSRKHFMLLIHLLLVVVIGAIFILHRHSIQAARMDQLKAQQAECDKENAAAIQKSEEVAKDTNGAWHGVQNGWCIVQQP